MILKGGEGERGERAAAPANAFLVWGGVQMDADAGHMAVEGR